jgi:hypothetical protein
MSIKINSIQRLSAMSANVINRYSRSNPDTNRNPLWTFIHTFQGTVAGYATTSSLINKFPFATDANATDVGDLYVERGLICGQSSDASGYTSGGYTNNPFPYPITYNNIEKFPFAADSGATATDVGDLTVARSLGAGQSSNVSGYTSGGYAAPPFRSSNVIDKFPFATDANATDVGDLTLARRGAAGQSSDVSGYTSGGQRAPQPSPPIGTFLVNNIDKFPFASNSNATDVGDLTVLTAYTAGQSSTVSGYTSGGYARTPPGLPAPTTPVTRRNIIEKFPFATNDNSTDIGDLTVARSSVSGQSSTLSGYTSGGNNPSFSPPVLNVIDKFPFATNANATDVGDLTEQISGLVGQQD